jgi:gentisate 1,2-dioxygenase
MMPIEGEIVSFPEYLDRNIRPRSAAVVWKGAAITAAMSRYPRTERGTIAFMNPGQSGGVAIAPGLSAAIQEIAPGEQTTPHAHSFWHLYLVRAGSGVAVIDNDRIEFQDGDMLFVPAWAQHAFLNTTDNRVLSLMALQNLPLVCELGDYARQGCSGPIQLVQRQQGLSPPTAR